MCVYAAISLCVQIALAYERKYKEYSRLVQFAKLYLYAPSAGAPLATGCACLTPCCRPVHVPAGDDGRRGPVLRGAHQAEPAAARYPLEEPARASLHWCVVCGVS